MSAVLLALYHRLPWPVPSLAASLHGLFLRSWRYGNETERLVEETLERETWSPERWTAWREERLTRVLHRAATKVPYYRSLWTSRRRAGEQSSWECLENWPILEQESLRANPRALVADDQDVRRMFHEQTSGTTGKPLDLWWSRATVREWYALFEARCRRWHGVSRRDRWAVLGGQLVISVRRHRPPFWVWNAALNQLYMSSYHLAPDLIPHYFDALRRYQIRYLYGYCSSLYALAQEALQSELKVPELAVVITNAEPLFDYQREVIAEAFRCPVRETYGMAEIVAAASECPAGRLHLWPEVGLLEFLGKDGAAAEGVAGDLVCTGLLNADMPLIRYRMGDRGTASSGEPPCACGRSLPALASIDGRSDDVLYTSDGRAVGRLDPVFKRDLPIREAQIIQESLGRIRVRYVPAPGCTPQVERTIARGLRDRLGDVEVRFQHVKSLPRTENGKFRAVLNNMHQKRPLHPFEFI